MHCNLFIYIIFYIVQPNNIFKIYFDLLNMNKNISKDLETKQKKENIADL